MTAARYATTLEAIGRASRRIGRRRDPLDRAVEYGELISVLQEQVSALAGERDAAVREILTGGTAMSHRQLATVLGLSAQRVDQLAKIARSGDRTRRDT